MKVGVVLKPNYVPGPALWPLSRRGGCSDEGAKRDKNSNKNHPRKGQKREIVKQEPSKGGATHYIVSNTIHISERNDHL